jgi:predicted TIM-barrel fold metal-dependent hydrolase
VRRFYFDTALAPGPQTFGSLKAVADPQRILFGSDWPYCSEPMVDDMIEALSQSAPLAAAEPAAVARDNALRLFPRFAAPMT